MFYRVFQFVESTVCVWCSRQSIMKQRMFMRSQAFSSGRGLIVDVKPPFLQAIHSKLSSESAIIDIHGTHTYKEIIDNSKKLSERILTLAKREEVSEYLNGERIVFLCPNNVIYTVVQWATWMSGGMAVPLCNIHPKSELDYIVTHSQASLLICTSSYIEKILPIAERHEINVLEVDESYFLPSNKRCLSHFFSAKLFTKKKQEFSPDYENEERWNNMNWGEKNAMLIYTSGTTGRPKGVVSTFSNLQAQIKMVVESWKISSSDISLHTLPLHHIHGIVNALACPLWCGATVIMEPKFNAEKVWQRLIEDPRINVFNAVPTMYALLIEYCMTNFTADQKIKIRNILEEKMRVMISGSAALPEPILKKWEEISGHILLERYGMTEIGMALTNSLEGKRVPGAVGRPFPAVQVKIVSSTTNKTLVVGDSCKTAIMPGTVDREGQLLIKGPSVFKEYWNNPEAPKETFSEDQWFVTGDTAMYDEVDDVFRILGRTSVDIIKSGGYKISALDVERHLLSYEKIKEVAVVGLPDDTYGQVLCAIIVAEKSYGDLTLLELRDWAKDVMPVYQIPHQLRVVNEIPRNAMGKVNKKELVKDFLKL